MGIKRDSVFIYYVALAIYFALATLSHSMLGQHDIMDIVIKLGRYTCTLVILVKILMERRWAREEFLYMVLGLLLSIMIAFVMGSGLPFVLVVLIMGARNCSGRTIAKIHLASVGFVVGISTILSLLGVVEDRLFVRADSNVPRHSFGMTYVTVWAAFIFFLCASYVYSKERIKWYDYLILLFFTAIIHVYTSTRLEAGMLLLLCLGLYIFNWIEKSGLMKKIMIWAFPLFALFIFALQFIYMQNPARYRMLNTILSSRLSYTSDVMKKFDLNLFGNVIEMQGYGSVDFDESIGYFFVDSFYIHYALRYGLIFMIALCVFFVMISKYLYSKGCIEVLFYLLFVCAHGTIISIIMLPQLSPFFIIAFAEYSNIRKAELKQIGGEVGDNM